jgi:hypothetical protein
MTKTKLAAALASARPFGYATIARPDKVNAARFHLWELTTSAVARACSTSEKEYRKFMEMACVSQESISRYASYEF